MPLGEHIGNNQSDMSAGLHFSKKWSAQTDCRIVGVGFVLTIAGDAIPNAEAFGRFDRENWISAPIEPQDATVT